MKVLLPIILHELTHCIADAFEAEGHEVMPVDWRKVWKPRGANGVNELLMSAAREFRPDLVFMQVQSPRIVAPRTCIEWKDMGAFVVNWCGDVRDPQPPWYRDLAPYVDVTAFSNMTDVEIMRGYGFRSEFLQIGYDPRLYFTDPKVDRRRTGVVFLGNDCAGKYPESASRREVVRALAKEFGPRFQAYGVGQPGGAVMAPKDADLYRRAIVAVNWDHFHRPWFASDRLLRATACGCAVASQYYEGIIWEHPGVYHARKVDQLVEMAVQLYSMGRVKGCGDDNARNTLERHTWAPRVKRIMEMYHGTVQDPNHPSQTFGAFGAER